VDVKRVKSEDAGDKVGQATRHSVPDMDSRTRETYARWLGFNALLSLLKGVTKNMFDLDKSQSNLINSCQSTDTHRVKHGPTNSEIRSSA